MKFTSNVSVNTADNVGESDEITVNLVSTSEPKPEVPEPTDPSIDILAPQVAFVTPVANQSVSVTLEAVAFEKAGNSTSSLIKVNNK